MAKEAHKGKSLAEVAQLYGIGQYDMHLFLCAGPECCSEETGASAWQALKSKVKALFVKPWDAKMYRTRVDCLRMCQDGPIAVCYPQGRWFRGVTADQVDGIVDHLIAGNPEQHPLEFARNPLPRPAGPHG